MADTKISALTGATTPLAGTEVLPIVQSGTTKKVAVSDLTAGRAVSAASLTLTTTPLPVASGGAGTNICQTGSAAYICDLGPSGGFYYHRYLITYPVAFAAQAQVTFSIYTPGYFPDRASGTVAFMESTQTQSASQFTVTVASTTLNQAATLQWIAVGQAN
jgi:hypothetical protein